MCKNKKVTYYIAMPTDTTLIKDYDDMLSMWLWIGRYPKEASDKISISGLETNEWNLAIVTFEVKEE
jgi:hypothetical protein